MDIDKFEKYILARESFLKDMLLIVKEPLLRECYQIQLDEVEDIIHHFNIFVKGRTSGGLGTDT